MEMNLGRKVEHDPQSRSFTWQRRVVKHSSVLHDIAAPALDQGILGSCTGNAMAQWLNCGKNVSARTAYNNVVLRKGRSYLNEAEAVYIYSQATKYDQFDGTYPPDDSGSSGLGVGKAMQKKGVIKSYTWTFDMVSLVSSLMFTPGLLGINWYESMFEPDENGILTVEGGLAGGHEVLLRGYNAKTDLYRIRNNWTPQWGIKGDAFITGKDLRRLVVDEQGDYMIPVF